MISGLLAWSRKQTFRQEVMDPSEMLSGYYVMLRTIIDERVKLDIVHGRDLPQIRADRGQLETALTNLCTNARDSMVEKNGGGELIVKTSRADAAMARKDGFNHVQEGDYLLIEVIDNGAGIPPELVDKIFQPFFTTKKQGEGTGLGLASVYGIIKQLGGYVYPVSKMGVGTTFKIFLPSYVRKPEEIAAAEAEAEQQAKDLETAAQVSDLAEKNRPKDLAGRGRIMLVEDEDSVRGLASHLLSTFGYQVIEAADGEEALDMIKENAGQIDLLISDVVLPGMDGPALLKAAQPYLEDARVMFISGYAERDLAKTLDEQKDISFLPKPFTLRQLAERVKEELNIVEAA
jgi:two-component system cell cycle sensor histidine kinase/response regulator CckA